MDTIDFTGDQFNEIKVAADWIRDLESSDSRLHKESVIEKALMASKLGSSNAQCFLFNCYLAWRWYRSSRWRRLTLLCKETRTKEHGKCKEIFFHLIFLCLLK